MDTMRDRFVDCTSRLLDDDPRLAVVLADIGVSRFVDSGAVGRHPDRIVNVGIREQLMLGVASGMALEGLRPIVHSYAPFLVQRPFEQIKLDLGHQGLGAVLVSIGASYDTAGEGRTHQAPGDVALLATLPGWRIHVPGHPAEVEELLGRAASSDERVYIRLAEDVNDSALPVADGKLIPIRRGRRGIVIAVGPTLERVLQATSGLDVGVLYTATVRPFDAAGLRALTSRPDVVLVEPYLEGTSSAEVSASLADRRHRLLALGVPRTEHRHYGSRHEHDAAHALDAAGLRARIDAFLTR